MTKRNRLLLSCELHASLMVVFFFFFLLLILFVFCFLFFDFPKMKPEYFCLVLFDFTYSSHYDNYSRFPVVPECSMLSTAVGNTTQTKRGNVTVTVTSLALF